MYLFQTHQECLYRCDVLGPHCARQLAANNKTKEKKKRKEKRRKEIEEIEGKYIWCCYYNILCLCEGDDEQSEHIPRLCWAVTRNNSNAARNNTHRPATHAHPIPAQATTCMH